MTRTLGIHWIATTFGTWLHGDPRGSWRNGQLIGPDPFLEESIYQRLTADAVVLSDVEMILVAATFGECVAQNSWTVLAATVQPTHVHLVFASLNEPIQRVIAMLKSRSARRVLALRRQMRRPVGRSLWTEGQFAVFIFNDRHLNNAVEYVRRHNSRVGRPNDAYPWVAKPAPAKPAPAKPAPAKPAPAKPAPARTGRDGPAI